MATPESAINGAGKNPPPYIAHKTFTNFINGLAQGMPSRIDKSVMSTLAGSTQGQLLATLRYFGLIRADGTPEKLLTELVNSEGEDRKKLIGDIVKRSYDFVFSSGLNLQTATTGQVEELFTAEGVAGETRRKAFSFFLALCKDGEIKLSSHIKPPKGVTGTRRRSARAGANDQTPPDTSIVQPPPAGTSKTIQLKSGGELSLSMNVNLFDLVGDERTFVFGLIDQIQAYERGESERGEE
jgi:uncharacterized protein DUF5343